MRRLAAQRLLPGEGHDVELGPIERLRESGRSRVANCKTLTRGADPVGIRHAYAGRGSVPGENDIGGRIGLGEIGNLAITRGELGDVLQLELLDDIGDPALA